jgi:hypothetical protein
LGEYLLLTEDSCIEICVPIKWANDSCIEVCAAIIKQKWDEEGGEIMGEKKS